MAHPGPSCACDNCVERRYSTPQMPPSVALLREPPPRPEPTTVPGIRPPEPPPVPYRGNGPDVIVISPTIAWQTLSAAFVGICIMVLALAGWAHAAVVNLGAGFAFGMMLSAVMANMRAAHALRRYRAYQAEQARQLGPEAGAPGRTADPIHAKLTAELVNTVKVSQVRGDDLRQLTPERLAQIRPPTSAPAAVRPHRDPPPPTSDPGPGKDR